MYSSYTRTVFLRISPNIQHNDCLWGGYRGQEDWDAGTLIKHLLCLLTHREYVTFPISKETSKHIKFFKLPIPQSPSQPWVWGLMESDGCELPGGRLSWLGTSLPRRL